MVQVQYLGRFLDIKESEKVTYTMQVQDLADVSSVSSSFTTSFKLPKTKNNYEAFKSLSLPSDTSNVPYVKNVCKLYNYGTSLIDDGWLKLNSSDNDYFNVNIENGIIDFFKAIEGKTIGADLDLSDTNHSKDLANVIDSFNRTDYTYIIADYNGLNTYLKGGNTYINVDYLVPSLNNKYLWDKVFSTIGYTYSGSIFNSELFTNLWITYPKAPPTKADDEQFPDPILRFRTNDANPTNTYDDSTGLINLNFQNIFTDSIIFSNQVLTVENTGTYILTVFIDGFAEYATHDIWENLTQYPYLARIKLGYILNDVEFRTQIGEIGRNEININLLEGDNLKLFFFWEVMGGGDAVPDTNRTIAFFSEFKFNSYDIKLNQISQQVVDFGSEFLDISITEYIKEIMIRFALTPFIDVENKSIKFLTLSERINTTNVIDWTDKYIQRTNENYIYKDYAQRNWFKHKYNDENATFNNGYLAVNNLTLESQKDLYSSKFYSFNNEITTFYDSIFTNNSFPIWNREIKETINNDTNPPTKTYDVSYKGLSNRFYFIRRDIVNKSVKIGSQLLRIEDDVNTISIVNTKNLSYSSVLNNYSEFSKVLNDTRIHEIELNLDINDLLNLDLEKLYFFSQENQYYILNRLTLDLTNSVQKGEFIRVIYN